ncbi:MAG TPA: hypothetical protein VFP05_02430, partial [Thermomicrobiales bacterium]|nr:hypothetical protein [Thermomicrobiales bacterium]
MKPILIEPRTYESPDGSVYLAQAFRHDGARFQKGQPVTAEMIDRLRDYPEQIRAVRLDAADMHEDDAAVAIA